MELVRDERKADDYFEENEGIPFIIDKQFYDKYKNFRVDYVSNWFTKGFVVHPTGSGFRGTC